MLKASIVAIVIGSLTIACVRAADLKERMDPIVAPIVEKSKNAGLVVGIIDGDGRHVFGYGRGAPGSDTAPDEKTIYEIGSITKVFTTLLLARMVEEGTVTLDDPVRLLLPKDVKVPTRDGKEIKLIDLATHTSGLSRIPGSLMITSLVDRNPYAKFGERELFDYLASCRLKREIGAEYDYSNTGMGLLGQALTLKANAKSYEDAVVDAICRPLGMDDTRMVLSPEQKARLAPGHDASGTEYPNWDFQALAGAGALRSSMKDMLRFLEANLGMPQTDLLPAMVICHEPRHDAGKGIRIGLGWHILTSPEGKAEVVWHNGQTGGYHGFIGFHKGSPVGVVILCNSVQAGDKIDQAGFQILETLVDRKPAEKP